MTTEPSPRFTVLSAVGKVVDDDRSPEQRIDQRSVLLVDLHETRRHADDAALVEEVERVLVGDAVARQQCDRAGATLAQVLDGGERVLLALDDDRAQLLGERRLDRMLEPARDPDQPAHEADDAPQRLAALVRLARGAQQLLRRRGAVGDAGGERREEVAPRL